MDEKNVSLFYYRIGIYHVSELGCALGGGEWKYFKRSSMQDWGKKLSFHELTVLSWKTPYLFWLFPSYLGSVRIDH